MNEDGLNEVVLALTDRVVRSYQWQARDDAVDGGGSDGEEDHGQLVPMNKWEFGLQVIGSSSTSLTPLLITFNQCKCVKRSFQSRSIDSGRLHHPEHRQGLLHRGDSGAAGRRALEAEMQTAGNDLLWRIRQGTVPWYAFPLSLLPFYSATASVTNNQKSIQPSDCDSQVATQTYFATLTTFQTKFWRGR